MVGEAPAAGTFLDRLSPADRAIVLGAGRPRHYRAGEPIVVAGDPGGFVVLIIEGRAKVVAPDATGTETVLSLRGPGELVGELAAIDERTTTRMATVVALDPVVCRVVRDAEFHTLLAAHPSIAMELLRLIALRLRASDRRLQEYGAHDTMWRVARLLSDLAESDGRPARTGTGTELPTGLSQDDFAGMVGASRESVARALGVLRARGLVATGRRRVVVLDVDGLRAVAP